MPWTAPPGAWGAADPLFLLLIALGIEGYLGGRALRFAWTGNPRRALAVLCLDLARRLNRHELTIVHHHDFLNREILAPGTERYSTIV